MSLIQKYKLENLIIFILFLFLLAIGIFLRFYQLDKLSLWYDELYSITVSSLSFSNLSREMMRETNPPLFQLILYGWIHLFGNSSFSGRFFSFAISSISLPIVYLFARRISDKYIALSTMTFLAFSSGAVYYAQELRSYTLLIFLSSILFFLWIRILREREDRMLFYLFFVLSFLCSYTHYFGFILVHLMWVYLLFVNWLIERKNIYKILGFYLILNLLYLPEFYKVLFIVPSLNNIDWIPKPNPEIYIHFFSYAFYFVSFKKIPVLAIILFLIILPFFLSKKDEMFLVPNRNNLIANFYPTIYIIVTLLFSTFLISQIKPIVTSRNLLVLLVPVYFLFVLWLSNCVKLNGFRQVGVVFILSLLMSLSYSKYYYKDFVKEPWRDVIKYAVDVAGPSGYIIAYKLPNFVDYYLTDVYHHKPCIRIDYSKDKLLSLLKQVKTENVSDLVMIETSWDKQIPNEAAILLEHRQILESRSKSTEKEDFIVFQVYHFKL